MVILFVVAFFFLSIFLWMMKRAKKIKGKKFCMVKRKNIREIRFFLLILDVYLSILTRISSPDLSSLLSNVEMIHILVMSHVWGGS